MAGATTQIAVKEVSHEEPLGHILCTAPIAFGGEEQWLFLPDTKKFDLSRGSEQKLVIESDEELRHHSGFMIDPAKAVLIVIDMQNYFIHPAYRNHVAGLAAVQPILKVIEQCRKDGIQVIWLNWGIDEHDLRTMPPAVQRGFSNSLGWHVGLGASLPNDEGRCLFKGTWNSELYAPLKAIVDQKDLFFEKSRMSGLWSPAEPLHQYLRQHDKHSLIFAGVNTDQCVFGTLSDAYSWGWDCVLLADCTGTMTNGDVQSSCEQEVDRNMGFVTHSMAFCNRTSV